ncbi:MAG: phosphodiester glycosidase family protein [Rickettsiales bacterium]|nr:MAG: phosphodiester glycosidase family protein [Rickettsiales bacterium]
MISTEHACLIKRGDSFFIERIKPNLEIAIGEGSIKINKINKFAQGKNIFYFNNNWGVNTLSKYIDRAEIIIDQNLQITEIVKHGGNKIPPFSHVLSFPINADLSKFHVGQKLKFTWTPEYLFQANNFAVMGIPMLIKDNIINSKLNDSKDIHARTAVGIREDGKIVLVVAEHHYVKPILEINLGDIKNIFTQKKVIYSNLTVSEIKNIVLDNINSESKVSGLNMMQLATFMQEQGCVDAINLDGGGSSSMYVDGKYINEAYGDKDEAEGQKIVRPVSDAIVFYKRNK